ncbi:MAG: hypothetical protein QOF83_3528 [Solirubrobacteraceae bacterium]|jgi:uncharacterized membrane protein|nr:hypothetical protein [Solirubrobacteraceae bacterium]
MATIAASRPSGSSAGSGPNRRRRAAHGPGSGGSSPGPGTKARAKPRQPPAKAAKPSAARKAGPPAKAHKPKSAGGSGSAKAVVKSSKAVAKSSKAVTKSSKAVAKASASAPSTLTGKAKLALAKHVAGRALSSGADAASAVSRRGLQRAAGAVGTLLHTTLEAASTSVDIDTSRRPPVQAAVDAGVPIRVAWQEWIRLEWLPEGVDGVVDVKRRDDGKLRGRLRREDRKWAAQILDEREEDSFAWESVQGSDCAGLITFHALGDRLTRIELSLDIHPVSIAQATALSARWADRRAAADLRRFKARLELINPDSYADSDDDD